MIESLKKKVCNLKIPISDLLSEFYCLAENLKNEEMIGLIEYELFGFPDFGYFIDASNYNKYGYRLSKGEYSLYEKKLISSEYKEVATFERLPFYTSLERIYFVYEPYNELEEKFKHTDKIELDRSTMVNLSGMRAKKAVLFLTKEEFNKITKDVRIRLKNWIFSLNDNEIRSDDMSNKISQKNSNENIGGVSFNNIGDNNNININIENSTQEISQENIDKITRILELSKYLEYSNDSEEAYKIQINNETKKIESEMKKDKPQKIIISKGLEILEKSLTNICSSVIAKVMIETLSGIKL